MDFRYIECEFLIFVMTYINNRDNLSAITYSLNVKISNFELIYAIIL